MTAAIGRVAQKENPLHNPHSSLSVSPMSNTRLATEIFQTVENPTSSAKSMILENRKRCYPIKHIPRKRRRVTSSMSADRGSQAKKYNCSTILFSLPQELRDIIYEHVWNQDDEVVVRYRQTPILASITCRRNRNPWVYGVPR
jgi:hypothetical protein